jgi:hypothetical protein
MPRPRPPHLHREETRHGTVTWYVRRGHGPRTRIKAAYGSEAFWAEYRAALEGAPLPSEAAKAHTLAWAIERYRDSSAWAGMSTATRKQRENIYRAVIKTAGTTPLRDIAEETIRAGRERRAATPHSANNFLKSMRGFFGWAVENKLVTVDPTKGVKMLAGPNDADGFHTWTQDELDRYEARWPLGTRERLAFDLLLYTGLRRCRPRRAAACPRRRDHHPHRKAPQGEGWRASHNPDPRTTCRVDCRDQDRGFDIPREQAGLG